MKNYIKNNSKAIVVFFGVFVLISATFGAVLLGSPAPVFAASCSLRGGSDDTLIYFSDKNLLANSQRSKAKVDALANIPAGTYKITLQTYDDHSGHGGQGQKNEIVQLDLKYNNGANVLHRTGVSRDIPENSDYQISVVDYNAVLTSAIDRITAFHPMHKSSSPESVRPVCVLFESLDEPEEDLDVTCRVSSSRIDEGDSVTFSAIVDGGDSPFDYDWSGDISGNGSSETETFNNAGTYDVTITVTDSDGRRASDYCTVIVEDEDDPDDFGISCEVSDRRVEVGDLVIYSVDIDGGNNPFEYEWDGDTEGEDDDEDELRVRYDDGGDYEVEVTVRDDDGRVRRDTCPTVVVEDEDDDLRVRCEVSDTRINVGDRITIEVDIDGGDSPYDIEWDGDIDDIDDFDDNDRSQRVRFDEEGRYYIEVEVEDDDGRRDSDVCPVIVVDDDDDRDINVTTTSGPTGNLSGLNSVLLSQVPYTGAAENLWIVMGFAALLAVWSIVIAGAFHKRRQRALRSAEIAAFKEDNRLM